MTKLGLRLFGVLVVGLIILFVIGGISRSKSKTSNVLNIQTVGLPKHGIEIVGPTEAAFTTLASEQLRKARSVDIGRLRSSSVFVVNKSGRSVAALSVNWELLQLDGTSISHTVTHKGGLVVVSDGDSPHLMEDMAPTDNQLFSLLDLSNSSNRGFEARMGGGEVDKVRQLSASTKVTVSVDGVLFVDGTFVGPNTKGSFESLKAEIEARRDLIAEVAQALNGDVEAMKRVEQLADGRRDGRGPSSGNRFDYDLTQQTQVRIMLARRKKLGDKAVLDSINAELSKPQINLRKL